MGRYRTGEANQEWLEESLTIKNWERKRKSTSKNSFLHNAVNWGTKAFSFHQFGNSQQVKRYKRHFKNRQRDFQSQIKTLHGNYDHIPRTLRENNYTEYPKTISQLKIIENSTFYFKPSLQEPIKRGPRTHKSFRKEVKAFGLRSCKRRNIG